MNLYLALLRGINVGGNNLLPMAPLRNCLEGLGFKDVSTYIASGNAILASDQPAEEVQNRIEAALPAKFGLDGRLIRVLVLDRNRLQAIVDHRPEGFGEEPARYHSDAIFLIGVDAATALPAFSPREGVDRIWPGDGVIYSQRLSDRRTESRLGRAMASPHYKSMTIRSWNTTTRLLQLLNAREGAGPRSS